jgi:hypothetical protein
MKATVPVTDAATSHTSASATRDMLHLTNGKAIIPKITEAGIGGRIVPWDDVLHEGPVPAGLGVSALGSVRADFLALCGWGSREEIARGIQARDAALERAVATAQEIVLWFEHDLYDQLHLLQILDRLPVDGPPRVTAVTPSTYLGHHPHSDYPHLFEHRRPVSSNERMAARDAWQAFRSPDPRTILAALPRLAELAHLAAAMQRHLQQFPSVRNGRCEQNSKRSKPSPQGSRVSKTSSATQSASARTRRCSWAMRPFSSTSPRSSAAHVHSSPSIAR